MAQAHGSIRFARGTHATSEEVTEGARWHFLAALQRVAPDVLKELAEDKQLERLYDEASVTVYEPVRHMIRGAPRRFSDLQEATGARAELEKVLMVWFERYALNETWAWMLDAVLCTLWHWRHARLEGRPLELSERVFWRYYKTTTYKGWGKTAYLPSFPLRFSDEALVQRDRKALYAEAKAALDAAFDDFYTQLIDDQTDGDWQPTPARHNAKSFEWLALWQFGGWRVGQLRERNRKSENAIYAGLDKACSDLGVRRRQGEPGRPSKI